MRRAKKNLPEIKLVTCEVCGAGSSHWLVVDSDIGFVSVGPRERVDVELPPLLRTLFMVPYRTYRAESFGLLASGNVEGVNQDLCREWKAIVKRYYRAGYRYVRFEYEVRR